ncbi:MAG: hypothetical protein O3A51_07520 [Verrucomicrobia bacterium]|nr:hypothetical protein [Verrucomicrobiota bacterium]
MPECEPTKRHYFDTVTISNFALAEQLDLIIDRYGDAACITQAVLDEITDGVVASYPQLGAVEDAIADGRLHNTGVPSFPTERAIYRQLLRTLSPGEASSIAAAVTHGGIVVTDDRTARLCCSERDIPVTGTIGILKACCLDGTLTNAAADAILETMIAHGFYAPVQRISDLM